MVVTDGCNKNPIPLYTCTWQIMPLNLINTGTICTYLLVSIMIKKNHNDTMNKHKILYVENMGECNGPQWDKNMKINVSNISLRYPFSVMYLTLSRIFKKINSVLKTLIWTPLCLPKSSNEWIWAQHFVMVMKYIFKRGMLCSVCQWFAKKSDSVSN